VSPQEHLAQWAEDLRTLAWLHAAERPSAVWHALNAAGFPTGLALLSPQHAAVQAMNAALRSLGERAAGDPGRTDDALAADYAAIYLTHAFRASPCESVWRDEDHLMLQEPTFAVRAWYRQHGLATTDWRTMPDDHLAVELAFCAHLLDHDQGDACARFIDEHLMAWLPLFGQRVAQRADTEVYAALAVLTVEAVLAARAGLATAPAEGARAVGR